MIEHGYEFRNDNGARGEHLFKKKNAEGLTTYFLHVIEKGGVQYQNYLLFKDYLLNHDEEIEKYNALKKELFEKYKHDRKKYTSGKNDFIQAILKKAREKYKND